MNFDTLPGSNVNRYTGKEFPCKWMLTELLFFVGEGGGGIMPDQPNFASYTPGLETTLTITNTQYVFNTQGKIFDLFEANLYITASYGNLHQATFQVQGSFTNTLYDTLENLIKNTLSSAGETASSHLEAAQRELDRVRGAFNSAERALKAGQDRVNNAQSAYDAAEAEMKRLKNEVNSVCSTRSCGTGKDA